MYCAWKTTRLYVAQSTPCIDWLPLIGLPANILLRYEHYPLDLWTVDAVHLFPFHNQLHDLDGQQLD